MLYRLMLNQKGFSREHKVIPGILLPALMAGAFLLPALSPEDGIPVVQAGSCSAAPHCNESSTDVFLLRLLLTLPLLLFSPACLQLHCSSFLNMSSTIAPLFFQFMSTLFWEFSPYNLCDCTHARIFFQCSICCYYTYILHLSMSIKQFKKQHPKKSKCNHNMFSSKFNFTN